jgi:hypothetical protein
VAGGVPREGKDKYIDVAKDAGIGALGGAAVGALGGAAVRGARVPGKGALIGGAWGAGGARSTGSGTTTRTTSATAWPTALA